MTEEPRLACPRCGALTIAKVQYGYPAFSRQLEEDLQAGRIILGGCVIRVLQPDLGCTTCGLRFRADGLPARVLDW